MKDVQTYGLLRANPNAQAENNLKLAVCQPCTETLPCLDYYESAATSGHAVTAVSIDGTSHALTSSTVTSLDWVDQIRTLLASGTTPEIDVYFNANYEFGVLSVEHIGRRTINSLTINGSPVSFTRQCSTAVFCSNQITLDGSIAALSDGTTSDSLATGTYNWTGTAATDTATAATLRADLITALTNLSVSYFYVKVKIDNNAEKFKITINRRKDGTRLYLDGAILSENNCKKQFTAGAVNV